LYSNLYYGESIETAGNEAITRNIPLDPVAFDWNEFIKNKAEFFKLHSKKELIRARIINTIYGLGFVVSTIVLIVTPTILNMITFGVYVALYVLERYWEFAHKVVSVHRQSTNEPIPYSVVSFFIPGVEQRIKSVVADQLGRFYALVSPGSYYITIDEKQADGSYRRVHQSAPMELKRGILTSDIEVA
jgi:hypothetical protein